MRKFDFYEFTAILIPGVALLFGLVRIYPHIWGPAFTKDYSATEFGLFVILAYIAGQLTGAFGNFLEKKIWAAKGGWPTDSVLQPKQELLDEEQLKRLPAQIYEILDLEYVASPAQFKNWKAITRQINAAVCRTGRDRRVHIFNASYGMFRGLLVSFLLLLLVLIFAALAGQGIRWLSFGVVIVSILCAYSRMVSFGNDYARELFVQFLDIQPGEKKAGNGHSSDGDDD